MTTAIQHVQRSVVDPMTVHPVNIRRVIWETTIRSRSGLT